MQLWMSSVGCLTQTNIFLLEFDYLLQPPLFLLYSAIFLSVFSFSFFANK